MELPGGAAAGGAVDALPGRLRDAFARVVGAEGVITEPGRLLSWETDALTRFRELPRGVVLPRNTDEAARVIRLLVEAGIPLTPRGAGTGLSGGGVASPGGVLVGTARMNRILSLDPDRRLARVEAGVINTDLSRAAEPFGLYYAPDPSSQAACTLGGNVGENAGGPHCLKYGVTTRYVTGLTVVTGRGEVVELGGADRCPPLDLVGLFVGSEGLLGLATEIQVRLIPRARGVRTLLAVFPSTEAAGTAVSAIIADGLVPAAMEIMDRGTIQAVEASVFAAGYPTDAGAVLVVEFDGVPEGLPAEAERASELCREAGAIRVRTAADEEERQKLWQGRKKAYGAFGRITPDLMVQDATVPRSTLPEVLRRIEEIGARHHLRLANVFHAGDGNLHPKILYDRRDPELVERVERASREIMQVCVKAGGTITGEHGVGLDKRDYMALVHGPDELAALRRVQEAFDPAGVWNPGKVIPESADEGADGAGPGGDPGSKPAKRAGTGERIRHSPPDLTVTVDGEVRLAELAEALRHRGQWLPVDTPGVGDWTVEALVLEAPMAPCAPALGAMRDHLLGAVVETAPGRRLSLGGRVMKNVAGLDLVRPLVGSRGRMGRVVDATFRLAPLPAAKRTLRWTGSLAEVGRIGESLATAPLLPAGVVMETGPRGEGSTGEWSVTVRVAGSRATVEAEAAILEAWIADRAGPDAVPEGTGWPRRGGGVPRLVEIRYGDLPLSRLVEALAEAGVPSGSGGNGPAATVPGSRAPGGPFLWALPLWRVAVLPLEAGSGEASDPGEVVAEVASRLGLCSRILLRERPVSPVSPVSPSGREPATAAGGAGTGAGPGADAGAVGEAGLARRVCRAVRGGR